MNNLRGKTAVLTGAASGIGRALAMELAKAGVRVAISDVNKDGLDETVGMCSSKSAIRADILDVSDRRAFLAYADDIMQNFGPVDIVINNAGIARPGYFEEQSFEDIDFLLGVNLHGVITGTKAFLTHLKTRPEASIVNISSIFGMIGVPYQSSYNISKFGVRGLNECLWTELGETNVVVTSVHPGGIKTGIVANANLIGEDQEALRKHVEEMNEKAFITTAETVASEIVKAIRSKKQRLIIGRDAKAVHWLTRLMPDNYWKLVKHLIPQ